VANESSVTDDEKIAELTAIIHAVRDRVRARYPRPEDGGASAGGGNGSAPGIQIPVAELMPIVHARDAAQAKIASIGSVNPRAGGLLNKLIQLAKKAIARSLRWFVRDQVTFNRETVSALEAVMEALNDHNRTFISLAAQANEQFGYVRAEMAARVRELSEHTDARAAEVMRVLEGRIGNVDHLKAEAKELKDVRKHWIEWRADWERKLAANEIQFLRSAADLQGAFQHRVTQVELNFREIVKGQHTDYLGALERANLDIQQRLWKDLERIRSDYERLIHAELRLVRQRAFISPQASAPSSLPASLTSGPATGFDYGHFAEKFRGPEEYVRRHQELYKPFFAGCTNVLDIGCGRGEFLETFRDMGVPARGIDLGEESVAQCRSKGLEAEVADLFDYLPAPPDGEFDGIVSSQVVEHIAPEKLPEMIRLCAAKLRRGGVLALETPNPECLAIFATHFYLDPTHTKPIPPPLLAFYLEEAGFGRIEIHRLSPAIESMPEVGELPEKFRERFFGGLDYAIVARRL
jgi:2-polyprenyl-3-methyl-5-hydroxy-6-metoxy-1,4-benzoquinol methylase